jgi:redox-sensitive bicupin YhaK (pirin superfamily)
VAGCIDTQRGWLTNMLEVRRNRDRGYDDHGWLKTYYTFAFADYYDPEHIDFGPLKVMNEDRILAGKGYPNEFRRDAEVLTYLIEGELRHQDSLGNEAVLRAGSLQRISAGTGIRHTESNPSLSRVAHLLHICIKPAKTGLAPGYEQKHFATDEKRGTLRLLASPDGEEGSVVVHQDARIYGGLFHEAERTKLELAKNRRAFLHVVHGSIAINETRLNVGDGVKISPPGGVILQHGREADVIVFDVPAGPPPPKRKSTPRLKSKSAA